MEYKAIGFELKDLDREKRVAIIAHAVYDNIDKGKDISRKGMFNKSWMERKSDLRFFLNHDEEKVPGKVLDVFETDQKAYTKAYLGTHSLGEDTLRMMDEGIITDASFGFKAIQVSHIKVKGVPVRELKEVYHGETSVLTHWGMNPLSKVEMVKKSVGLESCLVELKQHIVTMENFCRNTRASDECIKSILQELEEAKAVINRYDTADTQLIIEPDASVSNELYRKALLIKNKI